MKPEEIGNRYGDLTVIGEGEGIIEGKRKRRSVICKCSCGNEDEYLLRNLKKGNTKYCRGHNKRENHIGMKFGKFTVVEELDQITREYSYSTTYERRFKVRCECGEEKETNIQRLKEGITCIEDVEVYPKNPIFWFEDFNNKISEFSLLRVTKVLGRRESEKGGFSVEVQCKCGAKHKSSTSTIMDQKTKGCRKCAVRISNENRDLKYKKPYYHKLESVYGSIKARCNNPKDKAYNMYGGRGIKVSEEWSTFSVFYKDIMDLGYREGLEIDRIDNDKGYSKENCQLLTPDENKLKQKAINLTPEDVYFLRSPYFDWEKDREYFTCSDYVLENIINYRTFINV